MSGQLEENEMRKVPSKKKGLKLIRKMKSSVEPRSTEDVVGNSTHRNGVVNAPNGSSESREPGKESKSLSKSMSPKALGNATATTESATIVVGPNTTSTGTPVRSPPRRAVSLPIFPQPTAAISDSHPVKQIHHSDLSNLCIINTQTMERIQPNDGPYYVENDFFSGYVFLMVRTPDVDYVKHSKSNNRIKELKQQQGFVPEEHSLQAKISNYFQDKTRRWEFQFQVKLKKLPTGERRVVDLLI